MEATVAGMEPRLEQVGKANLLKYLKTSKALRLQSESELQHKRLRDDTAGAAVLASITVNSPPGSDVQPRELDSIEAYLQDAQDAKVILDQLVADVVQESPEGLKVDQAAVKTFQSAQRKAELYGVRKLTDLARTSIVCNTPAILKDFFERLLKDRNVHVTGIGEVRHKVVTVRNGFTPDYTPNGYKDVKLNLVVDMDPNGERQHLCEVQLHLKQFHSLKSEQHAVYEWSRQLAITHNMRPEDFVENMSGEVMEEMIRLAREDWMGSKFALAELLRDAGRHEEAEPLMRETLAGMIKEGRKNTLGYLDVLNNMAGLLMAQGTQAKLKEAATVFEDILSSLKELVGPKHPSVALKLNNLGGVFQLQGCYARAADCHERALAIRREVFEPNHPVVGQSLNNLGLVRKAQGHLAEAESLLREALKIWKSTLEEDNPQVAIGLQNVAGALIAQHTPTNDDEAERLLRRAVEIRREKQGPAHRNVASSLRGLGVHLYRQGKYVDAEPFLRESLSIAENLLDVNHPERASHLTNLGMVLLQQGGNENLLKAEELCREAVRIWDFGDFPTVTQGLTDLASVVQALGKHDEARLLQKRALSVCRKRHHHHHHQHSTIGS